LPGGLLYNGTTAFFRNIKVIDNKTGNTLVGPKEISLTGNVNLQDLVYNETFTIKAGETKDLSLVADLANSDDVNFLDRQYRGIFKAFLAGDVKVVNTGENLAISKIVPNADTTGNNMTVKASSLTVALASTPISGTVVKKSQSVPVMGLTMSAGSQSDVTVTNVVLKCQGNLNGAVWAVADCAQRVTSLALYDGDTLVGVAKAPDTVLGTASISNMNYKVLKGTTKTLVAKATFASAASTTHQDKISVGLDATNAITAQDEDANTITTTPDVKLTGTGATQQLGTTPSVVQNIIFSGTITVAADAHPATAVVIGKASNDVWVPFARYKATAVYENMSIDKIRVQHPAGGDNANFVQVAVAQGGAVKGAGVFDNGATGAKDIDLTGNEIVVPKGGYVNFELWAKLADVQSSTTAHGATQGLTRTGHQPNLGILDNYQTDQWDANYAGKINLRTTGVNSGERVYFASGALNANPMVIRATKPVVNKLNLGNTVFSAGQVMDLYRVQIGSNAAGNVAIKQMVFKITKSANVDLSNFRLNEDSTEIPSADVNFVDATTGANLYNTNVAPGVSPVTVVVSFVNEKSVSGAGHTYTLRATVNSAAATGNNVTTSFERDSTTTVIPAAYLVANVALAPWTNNAGIFTLDTGTAGTPDGVPDRLGTFIWSDNSETNHAYTTPGSYDWFNDVLVEDLSQSASVSN